MISETYNSIQIRFEVTQENYQLIAPTTFHQEAARNRGESLQDKWHRY